MTVFVAELLGMMTLIALGNGVVANVLLSKSKGQNSGWMVITAGWAIAVMAGIFVSTALGGPGTLNPARTIAGFFVPGAHYSDDVQSILGQFVGAFAGAVLVWLLYLPHWAETQDQSLKLAVFSTGPAIRRPMANLLTEILATFLLIFVAGAIYSAKLNLDGTPGLTAIAISGLVWGVGLSLGGPTGYALNPARDLGPRVAHFVLPIAGKGRSDWSYAWIPIVGPLIGAVLAMLLREAVGL